MAGFFSQLFLGVYHKGRLQGIFTTLDEFYFTTAGKKILEN
jgi:hypothetical protein